jgi:hypothetical protein
VTEASRWRPAKAVGALTFPRPRARLLDERKDRARDTVSVDPEITLSGHDGAPPGSIGGATTTSQGPGSTRDTIREVPRVAPDNTFSQLRDGQPK